MKTILHIIETGGPGGAETVYLNLIRGLDSARWRHVAVVPTRDWLYDQLVELGVQPYLIPERWTFDAAFFGRMISLIRRERVDLIQAHLFGSAVRAAMLARVSGVPAVATLHGDMDLGPGERFRGLKIGIINRGLQRIVFVSEPLRRSFLDAVPVRLDLAVVIPNGIDASRFFAASGEEFRAGYGIMPDEFVVGAVGSPGRAAKGLDVFLDVAALFKARSPGVRFVIVGNLEGGRGAELLSQRASRGLEDDVLMTGFRSDVASAFAAFDVYALTSRSEGFSLSLIEAMASGLPVVATRCGGPEQIITDGVTGLLVRNESPEAIATAIERLRVTPEERRSLGVAARKAVAERFSLDAQLRSYERMYDDCLSSDSRRSV